MLIIIYYNVYLLFNIANNMIFELENHDFLVLKGTIEKILCPFNLKLLK